MMIVVAHLKVSGAFRALGALAIEHARRPLALLITVTLLAGVLSAFLVNDAICLVMAPIVMTVTRALRRNPLPYLVATATASNCGSVATITGNPQNMVIGAYSGISYPGLRRFARAGRGVRPPGDRSSSSGWSTGRNSRARATSKPISCAAACMGVQAVKASLVCVALAVAFFAGVEPAKAAVLGGAVPPGDASDQAGADLPRGRRAAADDVRGPVRRGGRRRAGAADARPDRDGESVGLDVPWRLSAFTAVLSNIVSNVPAVLALKPFVPTFGDPRKAWLIVAMSSTLAGNFTLLGSVANLIVAEQARAEGTPISFWAYFKVGLPLTLVTLAAGTWWLTPR